MVITALNSFRSFDRAGQRGIIKAFRFEFSSEESRNETEDGDSSIGSDCHRRRLPFLFLIQSSETLHSDIQLGGLGVHKAVLAAHSDAFQVQEGRKKDVALVVIRPANLLKQTSLFKLG